MCTFMPSVIIMSVIYAECRKYAHYVECRYAEARCAECHSAIDYLDL